MSVESRPCEKHGPPAMALRVIHQTTCLMSAIYRCSCTPAQAYFCAACEREAEELQRQREQRLVDGLARLEQLSQRALSVDQVVRERLQRLDQMEQRLEALEKRRERPADESDLQNQLSRHERELRKLKEQLVPACKPAAARAPGRLAAAVRALPPRTTSKVELRKPTNASDVRRHIKRSPSRWGDQVRKARCGFDMSLPDVDEDMGWAPGVARRLEGGDALALSDDQLLTFCDEFGIFLPVNT